MRRGQQDHEPPLLAKLGDRWRHPDDVDGRFEVEWACHTCPDPTPIEHERMRGCSRTWFGWIPVNSMRRAKRSLGCFLALCEGCSAKAARLFRERAKKKL